MSGFFSVPFEYVLKLCALLFFRHRWMCLKNSHVLEWFCLHQPGRGLWLPLPLWALLLWWLSPWRRTEAQWAGVDPERRQVFCLFLQGEADVVNIISSYSFSSTFISLPLCTFPPPPRLLTQESPVVFAKAPLLSILQLMVMLSGRQACFELIVNSLKSEMLGWDETAGKEKQDAEANVSPPTESLRCC